MVTRKVDGADDIGRIDAARDERRTFVNHGVVDFAGLVVQTVARLNQFAPQLCAQPGNGLLGYTRRRGGSGCIV